MSPKEKKEPVPAALGDALVVHDVELGHPERWGDLVLDHLDPGAAADDVGALLDLLDAANVEPNRRVELQGPAARRRLGAAEHHTDLLAQLVGEDHRGLRAADGAGQLPQRLRHEAGLEADVRVAHVALELGPGHQRGDRVDRHDVERAAADQRLTNLEALLASVGLGDEQLVDVDPAGLGVARVQGVLGVDQGGHAAGALGLGDDVLD
jgi:hypothetical protein